MELLLSLMVGMGLSAACGFRVFVPLFVMSVASYSNHLTLSPSFDWIGSETALMAFGLATVLEVGGYYVPWVDNFLDTIATPAAIVAGTVITASMVTDVSPFLKWTLAVIAGGGMAGVVQAGTVLVRGASLASTGGLGNPVFATAELGGSLITALLAVLMPILFVVLFVVIALVLGRRLLQWRTKKEIPAIN